MAYSPLHAEGGPPTTEQSHTAPSSAVYSPSPSPPSLMNLNSTSPQAKVLRTGSLEWGHTEPEELALRSIGREEYPNLGSRSHATIAHADAARQLLHPGHDSTASDDESDTSVVDAAHPKSGINASVFVLAASTLGAGILALPYAFADLGYIFGTLLLIAVGFVSSYSISLLLATARTVGATTYEDLGHAIFPTFGKRMVVSTTLVLIFGSLTAFFVIIADTLTPAVQHIVGNTTSFFVHREALLVMVAVVAIFPLCTLKSIHSLERWSFLAVGIIVAFSGLIVVESARKLSLGEAGLDSDGENASFSKNVKAFTFTVDVFQALPIICLAFTCQTMIFPIWNSLQGEVVDGVVSHEKAPVSSMLTVVNRSLLLCGLLYLPVGLFGFFMFGLNTKSDVLDNFPDDEVFYDIVRILFTFAIGIHYPIVQFGFRSAILTTWYADKTEAENRRRFWIITITVVFFSLVLAIVLKDLSTVFGLTGSVCAFPYCFMFPTLFYLRLHTPGANVIHLSGGVAPTGALASDSSSLYDHDSPEDYRRLEKATADDDTASSDNDRTSASIEIALSVDGPRTTGGRAYHHPTLEPSTSSPLLGSVGVLPRSKQIPAYILFGVAAVLWVVSIVVSFKACLTIKF